ncbi:hypothetical protein E5K87_00550 [Helicobacter pylori]|nr:hypothetical protein E5K87_00550 [Helicobacter pylori]
MRKWSETLLNTSFKRTVLMKTRLLFDFINEIAVAKSKKQRFLIKILKLDCNQAITFQGLD